MAIIIYAWICVSKDVILRDSCIAFESIESTEYLRVGICL